MRISFSWLGQFLHHDLTPAQVAERLTQLGLEVEHTEAVSPVPGGLAGVVVGYVEEVTPHPNADRLRLTRVQVGQPEPLRIVCGAPNVAVGQHVLVALVGTTIYPVSGPPITLKEATIRGQLSQGMICADDELGLGTSHAGIRVLEGAPAPGTAAATALGLQADAVFTLGLTPNRTDALGHYGVARDLAAALRLPLLPLTPTLPPTAEACPVQVTVTHAQGCPRYATRAVSGVAVGPSPAWLRHRLEAIGQKSINNVVDVTNYVMLTLGQPLHAFDAREVMGPHLQVRTALAGETLTLLDGQALTLQGDEMLIADQERPLALAGIKGGLHSGVAADTTAVVLESACFTPATVRRTARRYGLFTDAAFRFERGTDPSGVMHALDMATQLLYEVAGATSHTLAVDVYPTPIAPAQVTYRTDWARERAGHPIATEEQLDILRRLEFEVAEKAPEEYHLQVPTCRRDVTRPEDVLEEVLRVYGLDHIALPTAQRVAPVPPSQAEREELLRENVADLLAGMGLQEVLTNPLLRAEHTGPQAPRMANPLSEELTALRTQLLPSLAEVAAHNLRRQASGLACYEWGKVYETNATGVTETLQLALLWVGQPAGPAWAHALPGADVFTARGAMHALWQRLGLTHRISEATLAPEAWGLAWGTSIELDGHTIGAMGLLSPTHPRVAELEQPAYGAVLNWGPVAQTLLAPEPTFTELPRYPHVLRDLSLVVPSSVTWAQLHHAALQAEPHLIKEITLFDLYDKLPEGQRSYGMTLRLQHAEATLTEEVIQHTVQQVLTQLNRLGVTLRT